MDKRIIALGVFDGVHLGHQHIINNMYYLSKNMNLIPTIFTFNFINIKSKSIDNINIKINKFKKLYNNIDIILCNFNTGIRLIHWYDFIYNIFLNQFKVKAIVTGYNNNFGYNAIGNSFFLKKICDKIKINYFCISPLIQNNKIISSSYIKKLILKGDIQNINKFLGYQYSINGKVQNGKKIGRIIGYKTTNIIYNNNIIHLPNGVYITYTIIDNLKYFSVTNIGIAPTFIHEKNIQNNIIIETHILNFNKNIYKKNITIKFLEFIRAEIKFNTLQELKNQIYNDILITKKFYNMKEIL